MRVARGSCARTRASRWGSTFPTPDEVRAELAAFLPAEAALTNPVDMIATAPAEHYRRALGVIGRNGAADAVIAIFIPPLLTHPSEVARAIREGSAEADTHLPVLAVFMSAGATTGTNREVTRCRSSSFPEDAARALGRVMRRVPVEGTARAKEPPAIETCGTGRPLP